MNKEQRRAQFQIDLMTGVNNILKRSPDTEVVIVNIVLKSSADYSKASLLKIKVPWLK